MGSVEAHARCTITVAHLKTLARFARQSRAPLAAAGLVLLVTACATRTPAPVEERATRPVAPAAAAAPGPKPPAPAIELEARASTYTVKRGDTLYLIALDHGLDYRELAVWNNIANVDRIFVGQVLRLSPPGTEPAATTASAATSGVVTAPLRTTPPVTGGTAGVPGTPGASGTPGAAGATPAPAAVPGAPAEPRATVATAPPSRHSDTYKTEPKATKQPFSEHALREMQRAAAAPSAPVVAAASPSTAPAAAAPPPSPAAPASGPPAATAPGASTPPVALATPAPAPGASTPSETKGAAAAEDDDEKLGWVWPATGKIVTGFSDTANLKGIDIAGRAGQPVMASAAGKVVYAGAGLRGYGKLIIIKHNKSYLSAYAHNREILVKEGQQVARGQKIAEMGNTDADQTKLHFEIRRLGKPMDPLKYLPPA